MDTSDAWYTCYSIHGRPVQTVYRLLPLDPGLCLRSQEMLIEGSECVFQSRFSQEKVLLKEVEKEQTDLLKEAAYFLYGKRAIRFALLALDLF